MANFQNQINRELGKQARSLGRGKKSAGKVIGFVLFALIALSVFLYSNGYLDTLLGSGKSGTTGGQYQESSGEAAAGWHNEGNQVFTADYGFDKVEESKAALERLLVMPKSKTVEYDRGGQFGVAWQYDFDNSGCRTRADILQRDLFDKVLDSDNCEVLSGTIQYDPYTGRSNVQADSKQLATKWDVEHIVALEDVCFSGACMWGPAGQEKREQIANDPLNVIIVDGSQNRSKQGKTFDQWNIPLNESWRCEKAMRQIDVKIKYGLSVSEAEKTALAAQLDTCKL